MKTLEDLLEHQLQDLYSAESQIITAMPLVAKSATDKKLIKALEEHLKETKEQKTRLEEVCKDLGFETSGEKCKAMEGLIKEAESFLKEDTSEEVRDAGIIAEVQRIEHYEISGYGTAVRYAEQLGHKSAAKKLEKTLNEEGNANKKLNDLAIKSINEKAI